MSGPSGESCASCYYRDAETMFCHRYPPRALFDLDREWEGDSGEHHYVLTEADRQALTVEDGWCGEWRAKP